MKRSKALRCAALGIAAAISLSGCSLVDSITDVDITSAESTSGTSAVEVRELNTAIEAPAFTVSLPSSFTTVTDCAFGLDGTAAVSDGGTVTYQWYVNNVNSNGGGTPIEGATDAAYVPPTSETGIKFYYVVATNEHDGEYNMTTGNVCQVEVIQRGEWTTDEFGGVRWLAADGTYPSNKIVYIDGNDYLFQESGYLNYGWIYFNNTYYYSDENGMLLKNGTTPEGYHTDASGILIEAADPLGLGVVPAAEETPAEEVPAEQAATEETATDAAAEGQ